jgi:hypothetical protein
MRFGYELFRPVGPNGDDGQARSRGWRVSQMNSFGTPRIKEMEHVLIEKVEQLFRDMF